MKLSEVLEILGDIEDAYREMTPEKKKLYAGMLAELDVDTTRAAVRALIVRSRFLPTIAEIRQEEREARGVHPDVQEYGYVRWALPPGEIEKPEELSPEQRAEWEALKARLRQRPIFREIPKAILDLPDSALEPPGIAPSQRTCPGVMAGEGLRRGRHLLCKLCGDDLCAECPPVLRGERNCLALRNRQVVQS